VLVSSHQFDVAERLFQEHLPVENAASAYLRLGNIYFEHDEWSRAAAALQNRSSSIATMIGPTCCWG